MSYKVFIGNLDYDTNEDDLTEAFKSIGNVKSANIVRRGYRSKGYGFVEYETEEEAKKAVQELDKTEILNRTINVQLSNSDSQEDRRSNYNDDNRRSNYNDDNRRSNNYNDNRRPFRRDDRGQFGRPQNGNRKLFGLRRPGSNDRDDDRDDRDFGRNNNRNYNNRGNGRNYDRDDRGYGRPQRFNDRNNNQRRPQRRFNDRDERKDVEKVESETTIFVANLPFEVDDEELVTLFEKCGTIKTAHVVKSGYRSKGFGFVEFENQEAQQKAIQDMENYAVPGRNGEERNLSVKVAMVDVEQEENNQNDE